MYRSPGIGWSVFGTCQKRFQWLVAPIAAASEFGSDSSSIRRFTRSRNSLYPSAHMVFFFFYLSTGLPNPRSSVAFSAHPCTSFSYPASSFVV